MSLQPEPLQDQTKYRKEKEAGYESFVFALRGSGSSGGSSVAEIKRKLNHPFFIYVVERWEQLRAGSGGPKPCPSMERKK